ncbi:MAG: hypothetical protein HZA59_02030 [Hydrogenophilales bacterium]|nr:hypothetical protein [Hydrogenophilales bacterium]
MSCPFHYTQQGLCRVCNKPICSQCEQTNHIKTMC